MMIMFTVMQSPWPVAGRLPLPASTDELGLLWTHATVDGANSGLMRVTGAYRTRADALPVAYWALPEWNQTTFSNPCAFRTDPCCLWPMPSSPFANRRLHNRSDCRAGWWPTAELVTDSIQGAVILPAVHSDGLSILSATVPVGTAYLGLVLASSRPPFWTRAFSQPLSNPILYEPGPLLLPSHWSGRDRPPLWSLVLVTVLLVSIGLAVCLLWLRAGGLRYYYSYYHPAAHPPNDEAGCEAGDHRPHSHPSSINPGALRLAAAASSPAPPLSRLIMPSRAGPIPREPPEPADEDQYEALAEPVEPPRPSMIMLKDGVTPQMLRIKIH